MIDVGCWLILFNQNSTPITFSRRWFLSADEPLLYQSEHIASPVHMQVVINKTVWSASEVQNRESAPNNTLHPTSDFDRVKKLAGFVEKD